MKRINFKLKRLSRKLIFWEEIENMKSYKVCKRCGKDYKTEQMFISMTTFVGVQSFAPYNLLSLELRNCSCDTTLARRMPMRSELQIASAAIA